MTPFTFHSASSVKDAVAKLKASPAGVLLAGGQTLLPSMKQKLATPTDVISLAKVGLSGFQAAENGVIVGAMTTHSEVATSDMVPVAVAALAGDIGDRAVRHRGTLGGSLATNDPASDYAAACLAMNATVSTNLREIRSEAFFTGPHQTALRNAEVITSVHFETPDRAGYAKIRNPASRFPIVGVFVAQYGADVRVAVIGARADGVFRQHDMELALSADFSPESVENVRVRTKGLISDFSASSDYRAALIKVMTKRAVSRALAS